MPGNLDDLSRYIAGQPSLEYIVRSDRLVLVFAGQNARAETGEVGFEFQATFATRDVSVLFVRDLRQNWYVGGIHGLGDSVPASAHMLREIVESFGARRKIAVGHSSGGTAALIYGHLIGVDEVVAFSPQTIIHPLARALRGDRRWATFVKRAISRGDGSWLARFCQLILRPGQGATDLRALCGSLSGPRCYIHLDARDRVDRMHAERLAAFERITLVPHRLPGDVDPHQLPLNLLQSGLLEGIVDRICG